nr:hypothetical protein CFP56_76780 [Quercus suber]
MGYFRIDDTRTANNVPIRPHDVHVPVDREILAVAASDVQPDGARREVLQKGLDDGPGLRRSRENQIGARSAWGVLLLFKFFHSFSLRLKRGAWGGVGWFFRGVVFLESMGVGGAKKKEVRDSTLYLVAEKCEAICSYTAWTWVSSYASSVERVSEGIFWREMGRL